MTLLDAKESKEYIISNVNTNDEELKGFLFSLGCYEGEPITVLSKKKKSLTIEIKDGKYSIDNLLAEAIEI